MVHSIPNRVTLHHTSSPQTLAIGRTVQPLLTTAAMRRATGISSMARCLERVLKQGFGSFYKAYEPGSRGCRIRALGWPGRMRKE